MPLDLETKFLKFNYFKLSPCCTCYWNLPRALGSAAHRLCHNRLWSALLKYPVKDEHLLPSWGRLGDPYSHSGCTVTSPQHLSDSISHCRADLPPSLLSQSSLQGLILASSNSAFPLAMLFIHFCVPDWDKVAHLPTPDITHPVSPC